MRRNSWRLRQEKITLAIGKLHRLVVTKRVYVSDAAGRVGLVGDGAGDTVNVVNEEFLTEARSVQATISVNPVAEFVRTGIRCFIVAKVNLGQIPLGPHRAPRDRDSFRAVVGRSLEASQTFPAVSIVAVAVALPH